MAVNFPNDFDLIGVTTTPVTQYELSKITRHWKCNGATEEEVLAATGLPQIGDPHPNPDLQFMFVVGLQATESGGSACVLDVLYEGSTADDGEGGPVLPLPKFSSGGQRASATTNTDAGIFPLTVTNPATVSFYAISNKVTFITDDLDADDNPEPDDPPTISSLISWDLGFGLQPGVSMPALVSYLLTDAFVQGIDEPPPEIEPIVDGKFWRVTKRKTRTLFPYAPAS